MLNCRTTLKILYHKKKNWDEPLYENKRHISRVFSLNDIYSIGLSRCIFFTLYTSFYDDTRNLIKILMKSNS